MSRGDPDTRIRETYRADESTVVAELIAECAPLREALGRSRERARGMIEQARRRHSFLGDLNDVLHEFPLSTDEGHALMALAEALLRIPDIGTVERLIAEKLRAGNWTERADAADSVLGKVAAQALATASSIARPPGDAHAGDFVQRLLSDAAAPLVRHAALHAVRLIGRKFVFSENIKEALQRVEHGSRRGYWYSFDMLGEAARTRADAQRYFESYMAAIRTVGRRQRAVARGQAALADGSGETRGGEGQGRGGEGQGRGGEGQGRDGEGQGPAGERQPLGVSVKLSAL